MLIQTVLFYAMISSKRGGVNKSTNCPARVVSSPSWPVRDLVCHQFFQFCAVSF